MSQRFCNLPENVRGQAGARVCQWPRGSNLRWTVTRVPPRWAKDDWEDVCRRAWKLWEAVCGIRTEPATNARTANVLVGTRRIDGPSGVLAEAELSCGNITSSSQLQVWFDSGDHWVDAVNPPQGKVDALRVAAHEFGHTLGMGHNSDGVTNALMDPTISGIREPQAWDIEQAVMRYGDSTPDDPGDGDDDEDDEVDPLLKALLECLRGMSAEERRQYAELLRIVTRP